MNRRFLLAIMVGIAAILVAMNMGPKKQSPEPVVVTPPPKPAKPEVIFRATVNINEKTEITSDLFKRFDTFDTDEAFIKLGGKGITSEANLVGKESVTKIKVSEAFTIDNVAEIKPFIPKRLSEAVPEGKRAVTIAVSVTQSVGGFVREGDFVDIIGLFNDASVSMPIRTILSGVQVLSIGSELPTSPSDSVVVTPNPKDPNAPAQTSIKATPVQQITFAATPEEAEIITLVSQSKNKVSFYLLLRSKQEMEEKIARHLKLSKSMAGRTHEISLEGQTKEILIGGQMLNKAEALEIFYGKGKPADAKGKASRQEAAFLDPSDPDFDPDAIDDGYRGPRGPQTRAAGSQQLQQPQQQPGVVQPVEKTVEMYKGIQKIVINVK